MKSLFELVESTIPRIQLSKLKEFYAGKNIIVTGGASFIGSNLVELLLALNSKIKVIDDFSSGSPDNLLGKDEVDLVQDDLRNIDVAQKLIRNAEVVFHLAAIHGGRGFIEKYKQEMLANLAIDNNVFSAGLENGITNMVHASSACAYPITLQESEVSRNLLSESQASMEKPEHSFADGVYGWTKLIGEYQLQNHCTDKGMRGRSARIFTAYGERENESHAAIALIAKALLKADPYPIWGNGQQTRNFTHVAETALGLAFLGADETGPSFDVFNIGTSEHIKVIDFVEEIFKQTNWAPAMIDFQLDKPTGVASRASNNDKILAKFGWSPSIGISEGLARTIGWYRSLQNKPKSLFELEERLSAR